MPSIECPIEGCNYVAENDDATIVVALLTIHGSSHVSTASSPPSLQKPPKLDRPSISLHSSEELWIAFTARWDMFKKSTQLSNDETVRQLFQCCDEELGNALLKSHRNAVSGNNEQALLAAIKETCCPSSGN